MLLCCNFSVLGRVCGCAVAGDPEAQRQKIKDQQLDLATLRRDLMISRRETEDAQEFMNAMTNERNELQVKLKALTGMLESTAAEVAQKTVAIHQLTTQCQVHYSPH